jgi:hypothetical protein
MRIARGCGVYRSPVPIFFARERAMSLRDVRTWIAYNRRANERLL